MKRLVLALLATSFAFSAIGCSAGEVSADQQKAKKDSLEKFANDHKDPNREERPQ